jgi:hypothetical protein
MENKNDFQVKDKVYDLMFGNGYITAVSPKNNRVVAKFSDNYERIFEDELEDDELEVITGYYNLQGELQVLNDEGSNLEEDSYVPSQKTLRTLFHGHNLTVNVCEVKPERPKYVNVYIDEYGKPYFGKIIGKKEHLQIHAKSVSNYVTTIELTPKHLKD